MLRKLMQIFEQVQLSKTVHDKYQLILMGIYEQADIDEFINNFVIILRGSFERDDKINGSTKLALLFLSRFSGEIVRREAYYENMGIRRRNSFFPKLLDEVLPFLELSYREARYYSSFFIVELLKNIGDDTPLDYSICNKIQDALLWRLQNPS